MSVDNQNHKPALIASVVQCKCPRCRRGDMFKYGNPYSLKKFMIMNDNCPVCHQPFDMEPGFYYGTNLISYTLAVLFSVASFFAWWGIIGFSFVDNRFFWWIFSNAVLLIAIQPPLMRISRAVWLYLFVRYSEKWNEGDIMMQYNVNREQGGNW